MRPWRCRVLRTLWWQWSLPCRLWRDPRGTLSYWLTSTRLSAGSYGRRSTDLRRKREGKGEKGKRHSHTVTVQTNRKYPLHPHTHTIYNKGSSPRLDWHLSAGLVKLSTGGQSLSWGREGRGWPWPPSSQSACVTSVLSGPLQAQCALCPFICPLLKTSWKLFGLKETGAGIALTFPAEGTQKGGVVCIIKHPKSLWKLINK